MAVLRKWHDSRKLRFSGAVALVATIYLPLGYITAELWVQVCMGALGIYTAGNAAEHFATASVDKAVVAANAGVKQP